MFKKRIKNMSKKILFLNKDLKELQFLDIVIQRLL